MVGRNANGLISHRFLKPPVEDRGAGDGEGHHDDEVGEEGEGAEHEVGVGPEPGLDHLQEGLGARGSDNIVIILM